MLRLTQLLRGAVHNPAPMPAGLTIPNFTRQPLYKYLWQQQFVARQHVFNVNHTGYLVLGVFLYSIGMFSPAPLERQDRFLMNSPKYRMQAARVNPGSRPALAISKEQGKIRYFCRGQDHPFTLNETKELLFQAKQGLKH